jgi:predicted ATPase/DNA-binding SARP family transcriptional activator
VKGAFMLEIRMLGAFEVQLEGEPVKFPTRTSASLLAYLALNPGIAHRREKLAGLLWSDIDEEKARNNLRHTLWRLRNVIGDRYFDADKTTITFITDSDYFLDLDILEIQNGKALSSEDLVKKVSVYKGELLPGFYDEWVTLERERVHSVFEDRMQDLLDQLVKEGRWRNVREWGEYWIAHGFSPEPAYRGLMMAYAGLGDLSGVAMIYQRCQEDLRKELSVEPSAETHYLFKQLSQGKWVPPTLTEHPVHHLPTPPTPFIGREHELAELKERLNDPTCRLLTLVGIGGIGKSRLALQIAFDLVDEYIHGVYFIPLASVASPMLLISAIVEALGFQLEGDVEPWDQILGYLREKEMLLILDNFEQLLDSAGLLTDIISNSPKIKILTTSRERLNLRGEWLVEILGLPTPEADNIEDLTQFDVIRLFLQSAKRIQSDFSIKTEDTPYLIKICQLIGGMPLAVELAASWVRMLTCREIAEELDKGIDFLSSQFRDLPDRHKSIQVVFDTSWDLLNEREKRVFKKLAVFRGGFNRLSAEKVAGASLVILSTFVDKLFLHKTSADRYKIHGLLQQYTLSKLHEHPSEEKEAEYLHCDTFTDLLSKKETDLRGSKRLEAIEQITLEIDNIRVAWDWGVNAREIQQILRCIQSMWLFYDIRGWYFEGFDVFDNAIQSLQDFVRDSVDQDVDTLMAQLLSRKAWFAWRLGRYQEAKSAASKSIALARQYKAKEEVAFSLNLQGVVYRSLGSYHEAKEYCEESLATWREVGNRWGEAITLFNLGQISHALGEYGEVERPLRKGLEILRDVDYQYGATFSMDSLGGLVSALSNLKEAKELCLESLAIRRELNDQWGTATCLDRLGTVMCGLGEFLEAQSVYQESLEIKKTIGDRRGMSISLANLSHANYLLGNYPQARSFCESTLAIKRELGDRRGIASSLDMLSNIAMRLEDYQEAKDFCEECLDIRRALGEKAGIASALNSLAKICLVMGEIQAALKHYHEALKISLDIGVLPLCLDITIELANLRIMEGEGVQAIRWLSFVIHHPGGSSDIRKRAKRLYETISSNVSKDTLNQVWDEGAAMKIEDLEAEIFEP